MRFHFVLVAVVSAVWCGGANAQNTGPGVGLMLGNMLGVSAKLWHTEDLALAGGLGGSLEGDRSLVAHADYVIHGDGALRRLAFFREAAGEGRFLLYYGAGLRLQALGPNRLGVRVPVGIDYLFGSAPWDVFVEVAPVLDFVSGARLRLNASIGIRFYPPPPGPNSPGPRSPGAGDGQSLMRARAHQTRSRT